jgi:drug/metabolite transporter (DMT)-like permease
MRDVEGPAVWRVVPAAWAETVYVGGLVLLWWSLSISLTLFNKTLFSGNLPYPLLLTTMHMGVQTACAWSVVGAKLRAPASCGIDEATKAKTERMWAFLAAWPAYVRLCLPTALAVSADVALSNFALEYIPVSTYTICKSSTLIFNLLFSLSMGLQRCSGLLVAVVVAVALGVALTAIRDTPHSSSVSNSVLGAAAAVLAAVSAAGRWVLTEFMVAAVAAHAQAHAAAAATAAARRESTGVELSDMRTPAAAEAMEAGEDAQGADEGAGEGGGAIVGDEERKEEEGEEAGLLGGGVEGVEEGSEGAEVKTRIDPAVVQGLLSPAAALALILPTLLVEGRLLVESDGTFMGVLLLGGLFGGIVAFSLIFIEIRIIAFTSALTTTILGHVKESLVIVLSILMYSEHLSALNVLGLAFAVVGTAGYVYLKASTHAHAHTDRGGGERGAR